MAIAVIGKKIVKLIGNCEKSGILQYLMS